MQCKGGKKGKKNLSVGRKGSQGKKGEPERGKKSTGPATKQISKKILYREGEKMARRGKKWVERVEETIKQLFVFRNSARWGRVNEGRKRTEECLEGSGNGVKVKAYD